MAAVAFLALIFVVGIVQNQNKALETQAPAPGTRHLSGEDIIRKEAAEDTPPASAKPAEPPKPTNWTYSEEVDPMTDKKTEFACTTSINEVTQNFPYHETYAQLCIRSAPRSGLNAYFQLNENGQLLCDLEGCSLPIRFDGEKARRFPAVGPSDHSTTTLFINATSSLVAKLKKAKTTIVEIQLFENGTQDIQFDTSGLEWPAKK
jgi:hypothetical protein